jgi:hypothetical protein
MVSFNTLPLKPGMPGFVVNYHETCGPSAGRLTSSELLGQTFVRHVPHPVWRSASGQVVAGVPLDRHHDYLGRKAGCRPLTQANRKHRPAFCRPALVWKNLACELKNQPPSQRHPEPSITESTRPILVSGRRPLRPVVEHATYIGEIPRPAKVLPLDDNNLGVCPSGFVGKYVGRAFETTHRTRLKDHFEKLSCRHIRAHHRDIPGRGRPDAARGRGPVRAGVVVPVRATQESLAWPGPRRSRPAGRRPGLAGGAHRAEQLRTDDRPSSCGCGRLCAPRTAMAIRSR